MNKKIILGVLATLSVLGVFACTKKEPKPTPASSAESVHEDPEGYYTCPMHPQVHEHKSGNCPICGMALVKVAMKGQTAKTQATNAREIHATQSQLNLAGVAKYTVIRKDLSFNVPVSGRMLSSREVAFQVFESDLQTVKSGNLFSGSTSLMPSETLKGQIRFVDNLLDPSSRTVRVIGVLNRSAAKVLVEGAFHGEISTVEKGQLTVPEDAVLHTGLDDRVYIISSDNILKSVSVTLGRKAMGEYQILSGLNEGDVISTGPNFLIDSEAKIRGGGD